MWKTVITLLLSLFVITSGILLWQWKNYSKVNEKENKTVKEQVYQHINLERKGSELMITQKILGLSSHKEYRVVNPDSLFRWQCTDDHAKSCQSNDENPETFLAKKGELLFQYIIPVKELNSFLLTEWTSTISNVEVMETTIDIVEKERRGSSWIAGIPQIGFEQLALIDFYTFKGTGATPSLYWQAVPLNKKVENKTITLFSMHPEGEHDGLQKFTLFNKEDYLAVIMTDELQPSIRSGMMIISSDTQLDTIEWKLAYSYYEGKFKRLPAEEKWIFDLFTALTLEKPATTPRSEAVLKEISSGLSEKERQELLQVVQHEGKKLNHQMLDQLLGRLKGFQTSFFALNKNENSEWIPLYFWDPRILIINGEIITNVKITYRGNQIIFPFIQTMEALGFELETSDEIVFFIKKGKNNYTFYLNQPLFQYNGENFGLFQNSLRNENGIVYIENELLQSIFSVSIEEKSDKIMLSIPK